MYKHLSDLQNQIDPSKPAKKLALAVSQDNFSLNALFKAYKAGFISPVLIGDREETYHIIEEKGYDFGNSTFIEESDPEKCVEIAVRMVHDGEADVLMKGKVPTPVLLRGVLNKDWGLRTGRLLSHLAFFEVATYHKLIAVTDVAMNIAPTLRDKICIVENSVQYLNTLGIKRPKVAVLGAIEMVNESMQATTDAALLSKMNQRDQIKNCIIDGPLAFDNAVSFESAHHKNIKSEVAGDTDLLLMPDIEVGNVLYKSLVFFANAKVASVILGASAPIVLTSRSDTEESKFYSILLAALA
ncbi:bifunctional enoyl-CoA hydratase/phosphate acetyltransferase [Anaerophaga thermohalophila]|jgi:phosphate butyryltransferase|uniref:bifunctional enoyl-CoA hydratase/phosphate acetyltransferase n=1 Tax=Anaerophaga thermohalophila TaxID=177400 RepID=UPI0002EACBA5|nr:bifunctional enoyl-CoA hydratase/phosphate acetyltransferase [Anaerophaga thermohalophila]